MTPSCISALRSALRSDSDFYIYRLPGAPDYQLCPEACTTEKRPSGACFVVSTYSGTTLYMTPGKSKKAPARSKAAPLPEATTRESYSRGFEIIHSWLTAHGGKVVLSRVKRADAPDDIPAFLAELGRRNPDAYIFMFRIARTGLWLGASPELLLHADSRGSVDTVSLAGTRPAHTAGESEEPWDVKNIQEQRMVTDFITDTLTQSGYQTILAPVQTHRAGAVEHLMTSIHAEPVMGLVSPVQIAMSLAPTPAVCGLPRADARRLIAEAEEHDRGCYAGFSGPIRADGSIDLYVTIRCAMLESTHAALFLGGGNTALSDLDSEWQETEAKSRWYFL